MLGEVREILATHPDTAGRDRVAHPLPRRRLLVRAAPVSREFAMSTVRLTCAAVHRRRAAGWLSRVTGRGQGATISGRVMNAIAPAALAELANGQQIALVSATNGKTTTTAPARRGAAGRRTPSLVTNSTGANLTSGIAPTLASAAGPGVAVLEVDERVLPRVVDPLARRAARARQPEPRPARPLR